MRRVVYQLLIVAMFFLFSCKKNELVVEYSFNNINDRVWIGEDFWSIPLEDWEVKEGRVECHSAMQGATLTLLPYDLSQRKESFEISVKMGLISEGNQHGSSGFVIGSKDQTDDDFRAAIYFGEGISLGVNTEGYIFIGQSVSELEEAFDYSSFKLQLKGNSISSGYQLSLKVFDQNDLLQAEINEIVNNDVSGIIQLVNNFKSSKSKKNGPRFWFDDFHVKGENLDFISENRFGPVLWTMHTLSESTLKLTAQFPPISAQDNQKAELHVSDKNGKWSKLATEVIDSDARCASFKIEKWDDKINHDYKVVYNYTDVFGNAKVEEYKGRIKKDPVDKPLEMGALTCQFHTGYPYSPIHDNLKSKNPDILYFSGDQIYEGNGGYPIKSSPQEKAINSYLGKWYMFGWVFRDLMKDIPTICTPDDHDIFQGNLWGGGGVLRTKENKFYHDRTGFDQTVRTINAVNRTQCSHLPDPYDPTPISKGMSVWYTGMKYGRVSFGIISDRIFKSGPEEVATWEGRKDQIMHALPDLSILEKPGLEFLGERQETFLNDWVRDWSGVDMKVLLSQTVFANATTHCGRYDSSWHGDLDSGGWPKKKRDEAINIMRKGFAFQIAGDQHLPSLVQYGIDDYKDAGWCFCTPAISVCYSRWFRPDDQNKKVNDRPAHGFPNTGSYRDLFGNYNHVYAVGNPGNFKKVPNRYEFENSKSSGFGFVVFDKQSRDITIESWKMLADPEAEQMSQHEGWPLTINQLDNYGKKAQAWLPTFEIEGEPNPVIEVINQENNELEYMVRIKGNKFEPKVFSNSSYKVRVGYPETNSWKEFSDLKGSKSTDGKSIKVEL